MSRTGIGRTERVVIVGAGLGGLSCALHLAATGREVTVVEREQVPGGRVGRLVTPADWASASMAAGTPFAAAHTLWQTGPFRPRNIHSRLSNVVFVGSGTQPGVGVPMVLISGKLAARRITGG